MSALPRLTAVAVSAVLALAVLGAPTAALAAPGDDRGATGSERAATAQEQREQQAQRPAQQPDAGAAGGAAAGRSAAAPDRPASSGTAGKSTGARQDSPARTKGQSQRAKAKPAKPAKPADTRGKAPKAEQTGAEPAKADPRGNNGTFKVDGPVLDTSRGNEPHVTCEFRLNFFGYDNGQLANITFTAIAPTQGGSTTVAGTPVISTNAAKGGLYGGSFPATGTWTAADLGLDPTQAQHVKVSVESLNADGSQVPGGAKHKVFWLHPCAAAAGAATAPAETAAAADPAPVAGTTEPVAAMGPFIPSAAEAPQAPAEAQVLTAQAAAPATLVAAPAGFVGSVLLPQGDARAAQPATLPFTGSPQLVALLLGGLVSLVFGTGLVLAARRAS